MIGLVLYVVAGMLVGAWFAGMVAATPDRWGDYESPLMVGITFLAAVAVWPVIAVAGTVYGIGWLFTRRVPR